VIARDKRCFVSGLELLKEEWFRQNDMILFLNLLLTTGREETG
jgi:hypothetical protein